ncbi:MAG TPA: hypothetical protein VNE16_14980 [Vicinamibacterales bacterium]|nr:hypothetical protein [Vicinamibacterales bacterium]
MNVSLVSSNHQSTASSSSESREVKGAPDHDGDADDQSSASAAKGGTQGPSLNGSGQPIGTRVSARA